jgi:N-acetylmuramoyl-L-alanine amidase
LIYERDELFGQSRKHTTAAIAVAISLVTLGVSAVRVGSNSSSNTPENPESSAVERDIPQLPPPLDGPISVAIQPGHWRIDELPAEAARGGRGIGAIHGDIRELDINLAVVDALRTMLEAEGYAVQVVPATVPPGLRVDAFVSVHADWGGDPDRRGWKLAPPWRPSNASRDLAEALKKSFRSENALREDVGGVTAGMRGYFGFSPNRYLHATSPYTPAVLVELGFVTSEIDQKLMVESPEFYAQIITRGLVAHFATFDRADTANLMPKLFRMFRVGENGSRAFVKPDVSSELIGTINAGSIVRPVDERGEWYEMMFRNPFRIGWILKSDVVPLSTTRR